MDGVTTPADINPVVLKQLERLRAKYPGATAETLQPSGATLIAIPVCPIPRGWPVSEVRLSFLAPNGYPVAKPDCFWVQPNLFLPNNGVPKNSNHENVIPETTIKGHWFSWHIDDKQWSAPKDDLLKWVGICLARLAVHE